MKVLSILSYMWRPVEYQFCITASASGTINVASAAAAASFSFGAPAAAALGTNHPQGWIVTSCFSLLVILCCLALVPLLPLRHPGGYGEPRDTPPPPW